MVHNKETLTKLDRAPPRRIAPTVAKAQAAAAAGDAGACRPKKRKARQNNGKERSRAGAMRVARARLYQKAYRSTGRTNS